MPGLRASGMPRAKRQDDRATRIAIIPNVICDNCATQ
jgi:hypothetical protein